MRILGLLIGLLIATPVLADTPEEFAAFQSYQAQRAQVEAKTGKAAAAGWKLLADTDHANRLPYVKAWCHQRAALAYHNAKDRDAAEAEATAALSVEGTSSEIRRCHARAHSILAYYLALKADTLEGAKGHYATALELDPSYQTAKEGMRAVNEAIEAGK